jgi:single-stranded-DNA-specific exonuclease
MEIVDSSVTRPLQGIAFGQDSYFRLFKEKHPIDICYNIEENTHGSNIFTQLMVKDMRLSE